MLGSSLPQGSNNFSKCSQALLVLRVADAVLVRRMGDEPDKLRDVATPPLPEQLEIPVVGYQESVCFGWY